MKLNIFKSSFILIGAMLMTTALFAEEVAYTYYDGNKKMVVYIQSDLAASFGEAGTETLVRGAPDATLVKKMGFVSIYRVNATYARNLKSRNTAGTTSVSPVFTRSAEGGGMKMALPGGVIVVLDKSWNSSRCEQWIKSRKLSVVKKLPITGNYYEIASGAGLASLELANSLRNEEGVLSATPNWWREMSRR